MKKYLLILLLAIFGICNALYLSYEAYQFHFVSPNNGLLGNLSCDINESLSCSNFLKNDRALIFGIPFPMVAGIVYPIIFILATIGWFTRKYLYAKIITVMAAMGICFNGYIIYQESTIGVFCPLCALCTVTIILVFITGSLIWKESKHLSTQA